MNTILTNLPKVTKTGKKRLGRGRGSGVALPGGLRSAGGEVLASGFAPLDAELPGGGWPLPIRIAATWQKARREAALTALAQRRRVQHQDGEAARAPLLLAPKSEWLKTFTDPFDIDRALISNVAGAPVALDHDVPVVEQPHQRRRLGWRLVDDRSARGVHQHGTRLHGGNARGVEQIARRIDQRHVQADDVRHLDDFVETGAAHAGGGEGGRGLAHGAQHVGRSGLVRRG